MEKETARELIALNNRFYADNAASFSATRGAPWQGWERVLEEARAAGTLEGDEVKVLDAACGNLRFERWLAGELARKTLEAHAFDNCEDLITRPWPAGTLFRQTDILQDLLADRDPFGHAPACDLVACFGFFHHVPGHELRKRLLAALLDHVRPGGVLALSLWRFMDDARLARKAAETERVAAGQPPYPGFNMGALDPNDHLLGWQDETGSFRYCHHFTEDEVDGLAASVGLRAEEIARFTADGASGKLNRYLVLRKR